MKARINLKLLLLLPLLSISCGKEFLDIKRQSNQVIPISINDYERLLNNYDVFNSVAPTELALIASDEYTVSDTRYNALSSPYQRNAYIWAEDVFEGGESMDWNRGYQQVLYSNMALDVEKITPSASEMAQWNVVRGRALFLRSLSFFQLAQLFGPQYQPSIEGLVVDLPIRLAYGVEEPVGYLSMKEIYGQITADLILAADLLPQRAESKYQPSKMAAFALLARIYLQMADYYHAEKYAALALEIDSSLIDFNVIDPGLSQSFPANYGKDNVEVILYQVHTSTILTMSRVDVDKELLVQYADNDLRRVVYFQKQPDGRTAFKGSYSGGAGGYFVGLAIDELYLIRAESLVRMGQTAEGQEWLNRLLRKRHDQSFLDVSISDNDMLLLKILSERRKELFFRSIRWYDMKRYNTEDHLSRSYTRVVNGRSFSLFPGSGAWVWPIPPNEITNNGLK